MKYSLTLFIIYCVILLAVFFLWECNCRLRKKLASERRTTESALRRVVHLSFDNETLKENLRGLLVVVEFQEGVIQEFAPQHSDDRPVVDFPIVATNSNREQNKKLGNSTVI